jgi:hypothetical protein
MTNSKVWSAILNGYRLPQPDNCPDCVYATMMECWCADPDARPAFLVLAERFQTLEADELRRVSSSSSSSFSPVQYNLDLLADLPAPSEHVYVDFTAGTEVVPPAFLNHVPVRDGIFMDLGMLKSESTL